MEFTLTLTSADTNYNLDALIRAQAATLSLTPGMDGTVVSNHFCEMTITSDAANDGANPIWFGDSKLAAANYGLSLLPNQSFTERSGKGCNDISTLNIYVRSHASGQVLHFSGRIA